MAFVYKEKSMCQWGTHKIIEVVIPADLSHTGLPYKKNIEIDACIAPIVKALNDAGIIMRGSCCGHNKTAGEIIIHCDRN